MLFRSTNVNTLSVPEKVRNALVAQRGIEYNSTADDPADALHQLLAYEPVDGLSDRLIRYRLLIREDNDKITLSNECKGRILDNVKKATHKDYDKSKPRAVRRKMLEFTNAEIIAESSKEVKKFVCGLPCASNTCDLCKLIAAVGRLVSNVELSDVSSAFGGSWSHSDVFSGKLPFGKDFCCREGHGKRYLNGVYRFKSKRHAREAKRSTSRPLSESFVPASPTYAPQSPIMDDNGVCGLIASEREEIPTEEPEDDDVVENGDASDDGSDTESSQSVIKSRKILKAKRVGVEPVVDRVVPEVCKLRAQVSSGIDSWPVIEADDFC